MAQHLHLVKNRFLEFYQRHSALVSVAVFLAGFLFDLLTVKRIDDTLGLIKQGLYLSLIGILLVTEVKYKFGQQVLSEKWLRLWQYHDLVVHFLFGSLLRAYVIFYYSSASAITSFIFLFLIAALMLANELPRIQDYGLPVRVILYNVCTISFFAFLYPMLMGHVGVIPFWLGVGSSLGVLALVWILNFYHRGQGQKIRREIVYPTLATHLLFVLAYYTALIPPVPVAIKKMGAYHEVSKSEGHYYGKHLREEASFWDFGEEKFTYRPGDKIFVLLSVFSPTQFEDQIYLKWYSHHPKQGEVLEDTIPLSILGGRSGGFRGFGSKRYFHPGHWRILVETSDGRQLGRLKLYISQEQSTGQRDFKLDKY